MHKWWMAGVVGLACLFGVYLLTMGMPDKQPSEPRDSAFVLPDRAVDAEAAQQIFRSMCLSCHGDQLQGGLGPALAHVGSELTKEQLYRTVADGRGGMPAFGNRLSEDELITVATWLASLK
mgnify:CR=1 FL=1